RSEHTIRSLTGGGRSSVDRKDVDNGRIMLRYNNHVTPMAPYLFFLGVGTYATFQKEFEYPNGKTFTLELLTPQNAEKDPAMHALEILSHGIMWIHLHTGAHKYDAHDEKKKIWELVKKRDMLKMSGNEKELAAVRTELKNIVKPLKLGYVYTGDVYREIGMQNSNFGGMENVGNTTIVTNRIMPFKQISDNSFEYMLDVKCHEFYHNLNGSEVTGVDPFVLWLNEAVTVHIETEYNAAIMGEAYSRITRIMTLHAPMFGTFEEDSSPAAMPIIPKGFNTPDELITGMTYVKAPEFVKMIETLMGKEKFVQGLALYHQRFKHGNANTNNWLDAMEEVSGLQFKEMAAGWLYRTGFPRISVKSNYAQGKLTLDIEQKGFDEQGPWQFPFVFCPVDKNGKDMTQTQTVWVKKAVETAVIPLKEAP
ncbi:MAG: M1 family aminopeptidase, partial [Nanoarchaeota archaeon]